MGACYLIQGYDLGNVESLPASLKCLVDVASRVDLCLGWHIVAADKKSVESVLMFAAKATSTTWWTPWDASKCRQRSAEPRD